MYDVYSIRADFPILSELIYLDSAATSQKPVQVAEAMKDYLIHHSGNYGRGAHRLSRMTTGMYEDVREAVADFMGVPVGKTIFTKNATESINMVAYGLSWKKGDQVITTEAEHHSNLLPWMRLRERGVITTIVGCDEKGIVSPQAIEAEITDNTKLIAVGHVSNFFGSIQDIRAYSALAKRSGVMLLVDAAQSLGEMPLDFGKLDIDFVCAPGHKGLLGPQGTGILYAKDPERLVPVYAGGGTVFKVTKESFSFDDIPSRFEYGTPNIPGVIGLGKGVEYVNKLGVENIDSHVTGLANECEKRLLEIPGVDIYGPKKRGSLVSFNVKDINPHDVALILDETKKICVRSGQHCAQTALARLGIAGSVRASFGCYNTIEEIDMLVTTVEKIARTL